MKLLIVSTANPFTNTMLYKENYLIRAALECGHEVKIFASNYQYVNGIECKTDVGEICYTNYICKRYKYVYVINEFISRKLRIIKDIEKDIVKYQPDLIFFNSPQVFLVTRLSQIKDKLPNVKLVLDFSTKYINSATNWISLNILHKILYRFWLKKGLKYVDRVFYISKESKDFVNEVYCIPYEIMEHNNLPGEIIEKEIKEQFRKEINVSYDLPKECILFTHSGKMGKQKKTIELLEAFSSIKNENFRMFIIGSFLDGIEEKVMKLIKKDNRIRYLSFLDGNKLTELIAASDIYMQPGTISQTSQTAICCGCPIAFTKVPTNEELFNKNGFFIDNQEQLIEAFNTISDNPKILIEMSANSYQLAKNELNYQIIYNKILNACSLN